MQIGLTAPRPELDERIALRVDRMWEAGLVDEVRALEKAGLRDGFTASRALGYAQVLRFLAGECTEQEAKEETVRATRRFARRQESWSAVIRGCTGCPTTPRPGGSGVRAGLRAL